MRLMRLLAATPLVAMVAFWATQGIQVWSKQAQAARVVDEIRPLLPNGPLAPEKMEPLGVRGKVLFWDMKAGGVRKGAQEKLPPHLKGRPDDSPLTVVLVTDIRAEEAGRYDNGKMGYRQTATVYLAHWPQPRVLGSATVASGDPPWVVFDDNDVYADLDTPLVTWVQSLPLETSPVYQEMQAQHRVVQGVLPLLKDEGLVQNPRPIRVRGKALVWDLRTNTRAAAHNLLPPELRATGAEGPLTVFAITGLRSDPVLGMNRQPAGFQDSVTVSVVTLPDKGRLGTVTIKGDLPPMVFFGQQPGNGIHGPIDKPIADWIARLPRE